MEKVKKEDTDVEMIKEALMALSSSISNSSVDTTLPKLAPTQGRITGPTRRSTKGGWTEMEDSTLINTVKRYNGKNWKKIAEFFPGRSDVQCLHRWQKVLNPELIKGPWTKEEDDCIIELVEKHGCKKWSVIAKSFPGRIGKQCRERWHNHLNPVIKKDAWTKEEEVALIRAHQIYGNRWAEIARFLPGRADNSIKNHWNCSVKKKLDSYLAPGFFAQLLGIAAEDLCNHVKEEENVGADMRRNNSITRVSFGQKPSVVCPVFAIVNGAERDLDLELVKRKDSRSSKEELNDLEKSHTKIPGDDRYSVLSGSTSVRHRHDASTKDNTYPSLTPLCEHVTPASFSPTSTLGIQLPLGATICPKMNKTFSELVPSVATKSFLESPKKPWECAIARKSLDVMDMRLMSEPNGTSSSLLASTSEFIDNVQVGNHKKVPVTPIHFRNSTFGDLCYVPPNLTNLDVPFAGVKILNSGNIQEAHSPVFYSTPSSVELNVSVKGSSPESILRSAAKSFKNTPSIIRKRGRGISRLLPEQSSQSNHVVQSGTSDNIEDFNCVDLLNVKRLFLSPSDSLKHDTGADLKSVGKRLEYAFDLEWNDSNAKSRTSDAAGGRVDANPGASTTFMPSDNSHKLQARSESHRQNFRLLGDSVNCSL
ncbi:uncharacterized protein LOC143882192 [Tasmannia lanceolata]|uniref:uncharacterized protein LOC143882192 n=1 Tax=Tasmannia lanceolata TaxID=3420 RepID=UPI004063CCF9